MAAPTVVGICGPPGSGKSTLALGLTHALPGASAIFFDHYEKVTARPLDDIVAWLEQGGDCNAFTLPDLEKDLRQLKNGVAVIDPRTDRAIHPAKYLLFETPFGRDHRATGEHIDLLLWIDIPLDVALARNIRAFTESFVQAHPPAELRDNMLWLRSHMDEYLSVVRRMLVRQQETVPGSADLRIDGQPGAGAITRSAARQIMLAVSRRATLE